MNISMGMRVRALLDIYSAQRKRRHGCLSMRTLETEWRRTGMRRDDLHRAMLDSQEHQLLHRNAHGDFELTYVGEVAMLGSFDPSAVSRLHDWAKLRRLRLRRHQADARLHRLMRRHGDLPVPS